MYIRGMKFVRMIILVSCVVFPAAAHADLPSEGYVTDRLVAARVADKIRKNCDEIDARMFRAISRAHALKQWALDRGYSEATIKAFLDDKEQKARIYGLADSYLAAAGLEDMGWCGVGHQEIEAKTIAGSLLRN